MNKFKTFISHHGVIGQKWGVRNGPPYPLERTKFTRNALKTKEDTDYIFNTLTKKEKEIMGANKNDKEWMTVAQGQFVIKRILEKHGDTPIAFLDIIEEQDKTNGKYNAAIGIATNKKYRGQGYAKKVTQKGLDWINKNQDKFNKVAWGAYQNNNNSKKLIESFGYKQAPNSTNDWAVYYIKEPKKNKKR